MADGADTLAIRFADEFELTRILFPLIGNSTIAWPASSETRI